MRDLEAGAERAEVARLWSRAIDPQGVVVAMAPLQAEGATARATLAVGAGFDLAGTFVEITAKPTLAPASAALRGLRRAHEHAHVALRAERLSHFEPAAAAWRLSAGSWAELDDVADQAAALHFAARDLGLAGLTTDADALAARARQLGGDKRRRFPSPRSRSWPRRCRLWAKRERGA